MRLHEYQSKKLLQKYHIPIPYGQVVKHAEDVEQLTATFKGRIAVKAQVFTANRYASGIIKFADTPEEANEYAHQIMGKTVEDRVIQTILIEEIIDASEKYYLAIANDRLQRQPVILAYTDNQANFEMLIRSKLVVREYVSPFYGIHAHQIISIAGDLNIPRELWAVFTDIIQALYKCYNEVDATLIEISPLGLTENNEFIAINTTTLIDDNASFRQKSLFESYDSYALTEVENLANAAGMSYVEADGQIGCIANGAGLVMAVMDTIKLYSDMKPANFLDICDNFDTETFITAFNIMKIKADLKAVLIHVFGMTTSCNEIASSIIEAYQIMQPQLPVIVYLQGLDSGSGHKLVQDAGMSSVLSLKAAVEQLI